MRDGLKARCSRYRVLRRTVGVTRGKQRRTLQVGAVIGTAGTQIYQPDAEAAQHRQQLPCLRKVRLARVKRIYPKTVFVGNPLRAGKRHSLPGLRIGYERD